MMLQLFRYLEYLLGRGEEKWTNYSDIYILG